MAEIPIYGKYVIPSEEQRIFSGGKFSLAVKREDEGWLVLHKSNQKNEKKFIPDFSDADYFKTGKSDTLRLLPALPEKPLIFKGDKLHISPRQKLTFFVKIPLNVQVYFSKVQVENLLTEISPVRLNHSWFGEPHNGEPAFAMNSATWKFLNEMELSPFEAICPISIFNNFPGVLEVERLIIRVENMAIYKSGDKLFTSVLSIEYKGKNIISSAKYSFSKAFHGEKPEMVVKPQAVTENNLKKINFHFIKNLTGWSYEF